MSGIMKYNKRNRDDKVIIKNDASFSISSVHKDEGFNKYLKQLNNAKNFDKELYNKGIEYFNLGGILDEAKDELRNNLSFISGYKHAKRVAYIQEIEEKYNNKSR